MSLGSCSPLTTKVEKIEVTGRRDKDEDAYDAT
jgi:hypothetical protein